MSISEVLKYYVGTVAPVAARVRNLVSDGVQTHASAAAGVAVGDEHAHIHRQGYVHDSVDSNEFACVACSCC